MGADEVHGMELRERNPSSGDETLAMMTLTERFMSKIQKCNETDCWVWTGSVFNSGYGRFSDADRKSVLAHRKSYQLFCADLIDGMYVCHHCDNPLCVNPEHLFLGTPKDNSRDKVNKNRQAKGSKIRPLKLSASDAVEIMRLWQSGEKRISELAKCYSVSNGVIWGVVRGASYKWASKEIAA